MPDVAFTGTALSVLSDDASVRYTLGPLTKFSRNSGKKTVALEWIFMPGQGNSLVNDAYNDLDCCHFMMSHDAFVYILSGIIFKTELRGKIGQLPWKSSVVFYQLDEQIQ